MKEKNIITNAAFYCNVDKIDDLSRTFQAAIRVTVFILKIKQFIKLFKSY